MRIKNEGQRRAREVVSVLARAGAQRGRNFVQVDSGFPLRALSRLPLHLASKDANGWLLFPWLYGYGETLRDYRVRDPGTWRAGLVIVP